MRKSWATEKQLIYRRGEWLMNSGHCERRVLFMQISRSVSHPAMLHDLQRLTVVRIADKTTLLDALKKVTFQNG